MTPIAYMNSEVTKWEVNIKSCFSSLCWSLIS